MAQYKEKMSGITLTLCIALIAHVLGTRFTLIGGPVFAIFIGMLLSSIIDTRSAFNSGIAFTSKYILQTAVVLLGFSMNLNQVFQVGITSLPIILSTIFTALIIAYLFYRKFNIDKNIAILVGVGSSICGGSAIAATAPVIKAKEPDVAQAISVIFIFNVLAAFLFPLVGRLLGLSHQGFAIFAGTAINDTSSVTATATAWDTIYQSSTLEIATIVKLTRTLAIIPITLILSYITSKKEDREHTFSFKRAFPTFLLYFILASLLTTSLTKLGYSFPLLSYFKLLSKFFIIMAMAGVGLKTNFIRLIQTGRPAIALGGLCWLLISIISLFMQWLFNTW